MTKINVQMETTINTGDFNNVKLHYGLEFDEPNEENVPSSFARVKGFVEKQLIDSASEVSSEWEQVRKRRYGK